MLADMDGKKITVTRVVYDECRGMKLIPKFQVMWRQYR